MHTDTLLEFNTRKITKIMSKLTVTFTKCCLHILPYELHILSYEMKQFENDSHFVRNACWHVSYSLTRYT